MVIQNKMRVLSQDFFQKERTYLTEYFSLRIKSQQQQQLFSIKCFVCYFILTLEKE